MKKEMIEGGGVAFTGLYEEDGITWNVLIRAGGSISLYGTRPGESVHYVIYDTLDGKPPGDTAQFVISRLTEMAEGINALLAAAKGAAESQHASA